MDYDIAVVTDPRFPGGTSTAVAAEIEAAAGAGYTVALVALEAPNLRRLPLPFHPGIERLLRAGRCALVPPDERVGARLAQLHNPHVARGFPYRPLRLHAERRMLVMHHPPADAAGVPYYDLEAVLQHAAEALGGPVELAPVGPAIRAQLQRGAAGAALLTPRDWHNVIDPAEWGPPANPRRDGVMTIGRHSRPDLRKWPATRAGILAVYPEAGDVAVSVLGADARLEALLGGYPGNWRARPFDAAAPRDFLRGLDIFVYQHHPLWVEAFGYAAAEAMASGLPCILPEAMAPLFGDAALCLPPEQSLEAARGLWKDPGARARLGAAARDLVSDRFGPEAYRRRIAEAIGPPAGLRRIASPAARVPRRILLVSSNGIGMGHLTRMLALARRLPEDVEPVFVTMSQAGAVVENQFGWLFEYIPYHQYLGMEVGRWNAALAAEIADLVDFYGARVVVFDANSPFAGLIDAAAARPNAWWVWCRRAMWRAGSGETFLQRESAFDLVLEPGDLAEDFDSGLTVERRARAYRTDPIRLLDEHESLPRDLARKELGLPAEGPSFLLMFANAAGTRPALHGRIARDCLLASGASVVEAEWRIAPERSRPAGAHVLRDYPFARYFAAFDGVVSAAGYNSFHEIVQARLPAVFVPNESPIMDDQLARVMFAERRGVGLAVRAGDFYGMSAAVRRLLDPEARAAMRASAARLARPNGALAAATLVAELAALRRAGSSISRQTDAWSEFWA